MRGSGTGVGIAEILADGRLHGTPTIILHGRSDALIAPNHSSRAYYGLNRLREGAGAPTRYYEVTNAQHLDALQRAAGLQHPVRPAPPLFRARRST